MMELIPRQLGDVPGLRPFGLPRLQPRALQLASMTCTCGINTNRTQAPYCLVLMKLLRIASLCLLYMKQLPSTDGPYFGGTIAHRHPTADGCAVLAAHALLKRALASTLLGAVENAEPLWRFKGGQS
ncbi:hypothetical protein HDV63DRAFT_67025 [Trichoderma sp. SZMC 28014]